MEQFGDQKILRQLGHQVVRQLFHLMNQWVFTVDLTKLF